ncbi:MAG TPA: hypothetical protein VFH43_10825, partial [Candidatus Kapabacteria bacterium]|jgi:hypothetical protein|nr:hypothetical protein [Candidatus Kapabacteria bacterium]
MKLLSSLLFALVVSVITLGCSNPADDGERRVTIDRGRITWKVGTVQHTTSVIGMRNPDTTPETITIVGAWNGEGAMFNVSLTLNNVTGRDTVSIGGSEASASVNEAGVSGSATSGEIEIVTFDRDHVEGLFKFNALGENSQTIVVTDGQFNLDLLF